MVWNSKFDSADFPITKSSTRKWILDQMRKVLVFTVSQYISIWLYVYKQNRSFSNKKKIQKESVGKICLMGFIFLAGVFELKIDDLFFHSWADPC